MKRLHVIGTLVIALALLVAACSPQATPAPTQEMAKEEPAPVAMPEPTATPEPVMEEKKMDIVDLAVADGRFTTLAAALGAAGLVDTLKGEGPFTVFAPTDEAFAKLPAGTVEELLKPENLAKLQKILTYHVISGKVMAADVVKLSSAETVAGLPVSIKVDGSNVMINDAMVVITDIEASNGIIHVIDSVILPPADIVETALADGRFTTLAAALSAAGLVETLQGRGPFTVFAPTDEAFAKLPAGTVEELLKPENLATLQKILLYHVAPTSFLGSDARYFETLDTAAGIPLRIQVMDGKVMVNDAQVIIADIQTANGIIHVIDSVILPPADIVDTAVADGRFTTLAAALDAAGLVETLKGKGPFTVFAPTDAAFAKLPAGTVESLLKPENLAALQGILTYHVAPGFNFASDVVGLKSIKTVNGQSAKIMVEAGKVFIDGAQVLITDIFTSNGVIHVIDSVILPKDDIVDTAVKNGNFKTLAAALGAAGLVETLKGAGPFTVFAPTDAAFAKLPAGTVETLLKPENLETLTKILTYHVIPGSIYAADVVKLNSAETVAGLPVLIKVENGKVFINNAQVTITDIEASNGVIHVIDTVILPASADIVDTAVADGRFKTLVAAVQAAGLVETLKSEGPFTVFAPTDAAFAKLPAGTVESLLKPENLETLKGILLYHVVPGNVFAADVVKLSSANTAQGSSIAIKVENGKVFINEAQVIITDILTTNGVIHVIDSVILPPAQ